MLSEDIDEIENTIHIEIQYLFGQTQKSIGPLTPVKLTLSDNRILKRILFHVSRSGDYLLNSWLRVKVENSSEKYIKMTPKMLLTQRCSS